MVLSQGRQQPIVRKMLPQTPLIPVEPAPLSARILASRGLAERQGPSLPAWMGVRGFVDIHCHVVPGLDDGPSNLAEAAELAQTAYRSGTLAVIATPHRSLRYAWSSQALVHGLERLQDQLPSGFAVFGGCELELSDEAWKSFESSPSRYCLNRSRYVLVELPRAVSSRCFAAVLARLRGRGYVPILAHAERCRVSWRRADPWLDWVRQGCLLQITADAICGRNGRVARAAATELLQAGLVHFVASDAHDVVRRGPSLQPAYRAVSKLAGVEQAACLFTYNPLRVLRDEPIQG
jgi:protein-tyrosine phosphatase